MGTFNGIGTKFNGISEIDNEGKITATCWVVFLYFPIFPLWKAKLKREITKSNEFKYQIIEKQSLQSKEILKTYLFGWIITPLIWFGPLILCIREVADYIGIPKSEFKGVANGGGFGIYEGLVAFAILYMIIFAWKWKDWDEERGLPKNYKDILK